MRRMILILLALVLLNSLEAASQPSSRQFSDSVKKPFSFRILPQNFYIKTLPYSCKKEIQLQTLTRLPVFIRLGSKEQADYLEGKTLYYFNGFPNQASDQPEPNRKL